MRRHIMVVEDDDALLPLIARTLEIEGYSVTRAARAAEALEHLRGEVPDLIVSDIMMPEMDGYELLERLRTDPRCTNVPVIFLTALGDSASVERGQRLGVDHYLVKPFTPAQLLATVSGTLRRYSELRTGGLIPAPDTPPPPTAPGVVPTGIAPLDAQVGGLTKGRIYLAAGNFGAAKSVAALQMLAAALARGERAMLVTTERLDAVLYLASSVGFELREPVRSGQLVVAGLADGFEQLLETREDVAALGAEIADWAQTNGATHVAMTGVLTMLCSTPRLPLSAPLMAELAGALERGGATTLLVADEAVTPAEELAEAYLRRAVFGTIVLDKDPGAAGRGVLRVEAMRGVTGDPEAKAFRVAHGTGLVVVDPDTDVDAEAALRAMREKADLEQARETEGMASLVAKKPSGFRMRDPFALFLRDCLSIAMRATRRFGLVLVHLPPPTVRDASSTSGLPVLTDADLAGVLSAQDVLCWRRPGELVVLSLGSDRAATIALAKAVARKLDDVCRAQHLARRARTAIVHADDGETVDTLLGVLERQLGDTDAAEASAVA